MNTLLSICLVSCVLNVVRCTEFGQLVGHWQVEYGEEQQLRLLANEIKETELRIYNVTFSEQQDCHFEVSTLDARRAQARRLLPANEFSAGSWQGVVPVTGQRFGYTTLRVKLYTAAGAVEESPQTLSIAVLRARSVDERLTTYLSAVLVLLMFLNLGTVLDLQRLRALFCHPVGPLIGCACRFVLMPALGLALGFLFWPRQQPLQLALFYTALAPSGGLANVCTVFLKGNINLSLAISALNSLLSLGLLPLWIMVFGRLIFQDKDLNVPFVQLAVGLLALIVCLAVGLLLRLCVPKTTRFIFRLLKPVSVLLSVCLIGLTIGLNAFVFLEFTWQVCLAGFCLPLAGYLLSYLLAKLSCRSATDALTLAVETSVLNMTLPIVLLQSSGLEQPQLDLILVVPIVAALLSLLLMVLLYAVRRCCGWNVRRDLDGFDEEQFLVEQTENAS